MFCFSNFFHLPDNFLGLFLEPALDLGRFYQIKSNEKLIQESFFYLSAPSLYLLLWVNLFRFLPIKASIADQKKSRKYGISLPNQSSSLCCFSFGEFLLAQLEAATLLSWLASLVKSHSWLVFL